MNAQLVAKLNALEFICHALGVPDAVAPTNRELIARTKLRHLVRPEGGPSRASAGSMEAGTITRAVEMLEQGSLDLVIAGIASSAEYDATATALADWTDQLELDTARGLLQAVADFAVANPFVEIGRP